jgi:hypothetical protein
MDTIQAPTMFALHALHLVLNAQPLNLHALHVYLHTTCMDHNALLLVHQALLHCLKYVRIAIVHALLVKQINPHVSLV